MKSGLLCAMVFLLLGCAFVCRPGIEQDEAIFATPFFRDWCFYALPLGAHHRLPLMHMSYIGALKTWLYAPIFWLWSPSAAAIRVPAVFLGSAAIILFWLLLACVHSPRAAIAGSVLLASDTIFLLTTTFDWGPVALQHLLAVAGMLLAVLWYQTGNPRFLASAAFCCGLAFWDKAVFGWMFAGLCAGSLIFVKSIWRRMTPGRTALAIAALFVGALPLILYNLAAEAKFSTLRSNSHFTTRLLPPGLQALRATWSGFALFGITEDTTPRPNPPQSAMERASFALHAVAGDRRTNFMEPALIAALLLLPLLWRTPARNPMLFSIIAMAVGSTFMLLSGGGLSAHHMILLWPLPILFLAVAFAEASLHVRFGKWLLAAILCFLAGTNVLVTNQYLYQFVRFGSSDVWTDAVYPLAASLAKTHASQAVLPDWGLADQLCVLNRNHPVAHQIAFPFIPADLDTFADRDAIWVERTPGHEINKGANEGVLEAARQAGLSPVMLDTYYDRNGRAMFQTLRFRPVK